MSDSKILGGTAHRVVPADLKKALMADPAALNAWQSLTPLARNEWICWTTNVKQASTREDHVKRVVVELKEGVRRPCCWMGCIHRKDKALSPSVRWLLEKRTSISAKK